MDELGAAAGGAFAKIALLQQEHVVAARCGVDRRAHAGRSAADNDDVPALRMGLERRYISSVASSATRGRRAEFVEQLFDTPGRRRSRPSPASLRAACAVRCAFRMNRSAACACPRQVAEQIFQLRQAWLRGGCDRQGRIRVQPTRRGFSPRAALRRGPSSSQSLNALLCRSSDVARGERRRHPSIPEIFDQRDSRPLGAPDALANSLSISASSRGAQARLHGLKLHPLQRLHRQFA